MNCEGGILNENRLERDIVTDGDKINERKTKIRQAKKKELRASTKQGRVNLRRLSSSRQICRDAAVSISLIRNPYIILNLIARDQIAIVYNPRPCLYFERHLFLRWSIRSKHQVCFENKYQIYQPARFQISFQRICLRRN